MGDRTAASHPGQAAVTQTGPQGLHCAADSSSLKKEPELCEEVGLLSPPAFRLCSLGDTPQRHSTDSFKLFPSLSAD